MGLYIPGLEMPSGGYRTVEITFDADGYPMALADGGDVFDVIPVPPHGRLGDLDAFFEDFPEMRDYEWASHEYDVIPADPEGGDADA